MPAKPKVEVCVFPPCFCRRFQKPSCYDRTTHVYSLVIHQRRVTLLCEGSTGWVISC
jgi:hypothetical protein